MCGEESGRVGGRLPIALAHEREAGEVAEGLGGVGFLVKLYAPRVEKFVYESLVAEKAAGFVDVGDDDEKSAVAGDVEAA